MSKFLNPHSSAGWRSKLAPTGGGGGGGREIYLMNGVWREKLKYPRGGGGGGEGTKYMLCNVCGYVESQNKDLVSLFGGWVSWLCLEYLF